MAFCVCLLLHQHCIIQAILCCSVLFLASIYHSLFTDLPFDGHLDYFYFLDILSHAAVFMHIFLCGQALRGGV